MDDAFSGDKYLKEEFGNLIKRFKIKNVVETGTFRGETTKEFSKMVENVYTIESNKEFYTNSRKSLKNCQNVRVFLGSSPEVLRKILPNIKGNTLFFLDAHWGDYWPILDELKEISKIHSMSRSVIVIHDFYVPGKDFGFDSYHYSTSRLQLFLKRSINVFSKIIKIKLIDKQKLDYEFVRHSLEKINPAYKHYYNSKAEGARRGVLFVHP